MPGVNAAALLSFFTFGYVAGAQAAFDGMRRLTPGTALIVDARTGDDARRAVLALARRPGSPT